MKIFFSAGEPSGDQHAAHLIEELQRRDPNIDCCGFGGPKMEEAGFRSVFRLTDLAVMGFVRVVPMLRKFFRVLGLAEKFFAEEKPDAVVLVNFPGFNWRVAKRAKEAGIPVFFYLPPQLWAWASWRIKRVHKWIDYVLCGLPFEHDWYSKQGVNSEYVGHPFYDEVAEKQLDQDFVSQWRTVESTTHPRTVGVLPGSRRHEVEKNWPIMLPVLRNIAAKHPDVRFLVAGFNDEFVAHCQELMQPEDENLPLTFFTRKTPEIIEAADCCFMVSGSVSLEMLARATPTAVVYKVFRFGRIVQRLMMKVDYISLPNLVADREIMPEWIVSDRIEQDITAMTEQLDTWLSNPEELQRSREELIALRDSVMQTGATQMTADAILARLPQDETIEHRHAA